VYIVQIGDSRCYHVRGSTIMQVTTDQTVVQYLVDQGALDPTEAAASPYSNVLSQAIGGGMVELQPEISKVDLELGDTLLLCTDGLTRHVDDGAIARCLEGSASAREACDRLIAAALDGGGSDNVTVVVSRFV
jgi:protein phosphatase